MQLVPDSHQNTSIFPNQRIGTPKRLDAKSADPSWGHPWSEMESMDRWNAMQWSAMEWIDGMQCSGMEWNGCILIILGHFGISGPNLVVFCQTSKKVNCLTRRRHISAAYLTSLKCMSFGFFFAPPHFCRAKNAPPHFCTPKMARRRRTNAKNMSYLFLLWSMIILKRAGRPGQPRAVIFQ